MDNFLHDLKSYGTLRTIKKSGNVLFQGEIPRGVMMVRSGVVRAYTITSAGEERTVSLHGKGDIFPLSWAFSKTNTSLFYYEAVSDTRVFQVPKAAFVDALEKHPEHAMALLDYTSKAYSALLLRVTGLEQSRAVEKIGFTLYYLLFTHGNETSDGVYSIDIRLSHSLFASLVGLTRESTAKNMKILREKGIIEYGSFAYSVHKEKLEAFLGEDSFRDLEI